MASVVDSNFSISRQVASACGEEMVRTKSCVKLGSSTWVIVRDYLEPPAEECLKNGSVGYESSFITPFIAFQRAVGAVLSLHHPKFMELDTQGLEELYSSPKPPLHFTEVSGCYSAISLICGSRRGQLERVYQVLPIHPILAKIEKALHTCDPTDPTSPVVFTYSMKDKIDAIAERHFESYIEKYRSIGLTKKNAVHYAGLRDPILGVLGLSLFDGIGGFKVHCKLCDNHSIVVVPECGSIQFVRSKPPTEWPYSPPALVALHELMHVEENSHEAVEPHSSGYELLPSLFANIVVADAIYKESIGMPLPAEADYGVRVIGKMPLGRFANRSREIITQCVGDLGRVVTSKEFLELAQVAIGEESPPETDTTP